MNNWPPPGKILAFFVYVVVNFVLLFLIGRFRNSGWVLFFLFAFVGFMGLMLGLLIGSVLGTFIDDLQGAIIGNQMAIMTFGGTGLILLGLSVSLLITKKNFTFLSSMVFAGILVALILSIVASTFSIPFLQLAVSGILILLTSAFFIRFISKISHSGEKNSIIATIELFVGKSDLRLIEEFDETFKDIDKNK